MKNKDKKKKKNKKAKQVVYIEPTWGKYIPGFSYPSIAQEKLFKKLYPHL